ncbi:hypothetical protein LguiB_029412 [Lonicera macranthoides]
MKSAALQLLHSLNTQTMFIFLVMLLLAFSSALGANETDLLALRAIKSKIIHDPKGVLGLWNDSFHHCKWEGVTCGHRHKRVTKLDISSRGLVGSLSPYIGNLSFLRVIQLYNNTLEGEIPPEVGRLFRLQRLSLHNNSINGQIPANLSHCSQLTFLSLAENMLVGEIPNQLSSLLKLKTLVIDVNRLTGQIPSFIGNFTSLVNLSGPYNHLSGAIPDSFGRLNNLSILLFGFNNLSGMIPQSIYNLSLLTIFSLSQNQLHGSLPLNLGLMLPRLQVLQLFENQFSGLLPSSLSNCSELVFFNMEKNNFHGKIDISFNRMPNLFMVTLSSNNFGSGEHDEMKFVDSLVNCTNLDVLELQDNQLHGLLPKSIANFSTQLHYMSLGTNNIYGTLPSTIGNLVSLTTLNFESNQLTGTIPSSIGNLQQLQRLYLEVNDFSGKIPVFMGNLSLLNELCLSYNRLEGTIPSSFGNYKKLLKLTLLQNNLSGTIPKEIFGLSTLSILLNLAQNHLVGSLPQEVGNLSNLIELDVSDNALSGKIPIGLGSCTSLETLCMADNFIEGSIPSSLASLTGIENLDLSHNNLSGQIPRFLERFALKNLNLSFNDFEGELPNKGVFTNLSAISIVGNTKLCGGVQDLQLPKCPMKGSKKPKKVPLVLIIVVLLVCIACVTMVLAFFLFLWRRKRATTQPSGSLLKKSMVKVSYEQLLKATNRFSSENLIGVGSFGSVYKGIFDEDDGVIVAIKVLKLELRGASKSFMAECEALRNIRHRNLVKIITSCSSVDFQGNDFKALVYDFMPNGSLDKWLRSSLDSQNRLNFLQCINIAIDVANAIDYLHNHCQAPIIHCDLKPGNILLDSNMVAHVGDFGLAKFLLELNDGNQNSSIGIRGTVGYAAPEYCLGSEVSKNGDMYSYGILLLEMMTGKGPTDPIFEGSHNLHNFARTASPDHLMKMATESMLLNSDEDAESINNNNQVEDGRSKKDCFIYVIKIGVACSMESPHDRMDIVNVIRELHSVQTILSAIQTSSEGPTA